MLATRMRQAAAGGVVESLTGSYLSSGDNNTSFSIGSAPTGTERRFIVVAATTLGDNSIGTPTIGGNNATVVVTQEDSDAAASVTSIFYLEVSSGTSVTIDADFPSPQNPRLHVWKIITTGNKDISVTDSASAFSNSTSVNVDVAENGFVVGGAINQNGNDYTWTNLTEDDDTEVSTADYSSGASETYVSAQTNLTVTANRSGTSNATMAVASFELAA